MVAELNYVKVVQTHICTTFYNEIMMYMAMNVLFTQIY